MHRALDHPRNIKIGQGRVIYAGVPSPYHDITVDAWVLPGGERTQDEFIARGVAKRIDNAMKSGRWV